MPAPKGNKNAVGNRGGGRPSKYQSEHVKLAYKLALLGATDADVADAFDVSESTINAWKKKHVEFVEALKKGKRAADAKVAQSLYRRACGYSHKAVKIVADAKTGTDHVVPYTEHYPPDTTACIFWLKNRQPEQWRDKQHVAHSTEGGVMLVPGLIQPGEWDEAAAEQQDESRKK